MNYEILKNYIEEAIRDNDRGEITAEVLRDVLLNTVNTIDDGYIFGGAVYPTDTPSYTDAKVVYIAMEKGVYANFGGVKLGGVGFIYFDDIWRAVTFVYNDIRVVSDKGYSNDDAMSQAGATTMYEANQAYTQDMVVASEDRTHSFIYKREAFIKDYTDILPFYSIVSKIGTYNKGYAPAESYEGLVVYDKDSNVFRLLIKNVYYEYWNEISADNSITGQRVLSWEYYNIVFKEKLKAKNGLYWSQSDSEKVYVCNNVFFNEIFFKSDVLPAVYRYKVSNAGRVTLEDADLLIYDCTGRTLPTNIAFTIKNLQKRSFRLILLSGNYPVYIENSGCLLNGSLPRILTENNVSQLMIPVKSSAVVNIDVIYLSDEDENYPNGLISVYIEKIFNL